MTQVVALLEFWHWSPWSLAHACWNNLTVIAAPLGLLSSPQASKWTCYMPHLGWYKYTTTVPMDILQDRLHCSVLCQYGSSAIKTRMPVNWPQLLGAIWCLSFIISRLNLTWLNTLCLLSIRSRLNLNFNTCSLYHLQCHHCVLNTTILALVPRLGLDCPSTTTGSWLP